MTDHPQTTAPAKPFDQMTASELQTEYHTRRVAHQRHVREANARQEAAMAEMCRLSDVMRAAGVLP